MKVKNPSNPAKPAAVTANRAAVQAFIAGQTGEKIEFDDIRASFAAGKRAELTDGVLHAICMDLGLSVEP